MNVDFDDTSKTTVVKLSGDVTGLEIIDICKASERLRNDPLCACVAVDLSAVNSIDSSGLGGLIYSRKILLKAEKNFVLIGPDEHIKRLFRDCCCDRIFEIFDDVTKIVMHGPMAVPVAFS